ncbi:MAG: transcription termination/antitermination protein NusA [Sedimentisphaerales bacterium]|nr:transcription termination/antitermination protein NusA [Sedimentisphaerales bacterium]
MNQELLRIVDGMARDKNIDSESIFVDLEAAMASATRKHFGVAEGVEVQIDRESGEFYVFVNGEQIDIRKLGRIPAQTAKQVMIQKLREDERGSIYTEFQERIGELVTGSVARFEGGTTVVNLSRAEAILPRSEQIPGETHHPGERVRAVIIEVKEAPNQVKIILSRTHPEFIQRLFEQEVPEVAEKIIEIKALAREAGYRSKVAVISSDTKVDAVGACVGVRGSRIKNIVDELGGEKIDIVRWNESSQVLIGNALRPAEVRDIALCFELNRSTVVVAEDQLSLAIGKRGQNVRLAARLTNWDIDILTPREYSESMDILSRTLRSVEGVDDTLIDKVLALGIVSVLDMEEVGPEPLMQSLELEEALALEMVRSASKEARHQATLKEQSTAQAVLADEVSDKKPAASVLSSLASGTIDIGESVDEVSGEAAGDVEAKAADVTAADEASEQLAEEDSEEPEVLEEGSESVESEDAVAEEAVSKDVDPEEQDSEDKAKE